MVIPQITVEASAPFNNQRPVHQPDQEINYGLVGDQEFTLALLHKYNNGEEIEDDNGQAFSAEHGKPRDTL